MWAFTASLSSFLDPGHQLWNTWKVPVQHASEEISLACRSKEGLEVTREVETGRRVGLKGKAKETGRASSFFTVPASSP